MTKAPLNFKEITYVVDRLKEESIYLDKCYDIGFPLFDSLPTFGLIENIVDIIFTPDDVTKPYDTFSWWCCESDFGEKDLCYWTGDSGEIEHNVTKLEDIYKLMCEEKGCEPDWSDD